jgi:hypothetical protein
MRDPIMRGVGGGAINSYAPCDTMKREAAAACPPPAAVCPEAVCQWKVVAGGEGIKEGDDCCYNGALCYDPTGGACGRPLLVAAERRVAGLRRGGGW